MRIRPILPLLILVVLFALLFMVTAYSVIRNKSKIIDKILALIRLFVIYALAFVIGIRPMIVEENFEYDTKNLNVLFVVDTTISMWAQDYNGNQERMEAVKKDEDYIIDKLAGSNFSIITFDDTSHVLSPFTQDAQYIKDFFEDFKSPESFYARGSDLSMPYKDMETMLKSSAKKENRKTIVFFISDGEITNDKELTNYSAFGKYIDAGAVMGYGTEEGGRMFESGSEEAYVYDYSIHGDALSVIDESNLKQIASDLGVDYYNMYTQSASLKGQVEMFKENVKTVTESGSGAESERDLYFYFALPLACMLLLEIIMMALRGRL